MFFFTFLGGFKEFLMLDYDFSCKFSFYLHILELIFEIHSGNLLTLQRDIGMLKKKV